jgi:hypothetical protein
MAIANGKTTLKQLRLENAARQPKLASGDAVLLSPARKTINSTLTHVAKGLTDDKAEALVHVTKGVSGCGTARP